MKIAKATLLIIFSTGAALNIPASAQTSPTSTPAPTEKLSEQLSKNLQKYDPNAGVSREKREMAYGKLFEAQRNISRMMAQRTQSGMEAFAGQARSAILESLQFDPGISESYVALVELTLITSSDFNEALSLSLLATKLN